VRISSIAARTAVEIWSGGKGRVGDDLAAHELQRPGERRPVGVQVLSQRGLVHELADGVVDQQVRPDLLGDPSGVLSAAPPWGHAGWS